MKKIKNYSSVRDIARESSKHATINRVVGYNKRHAFWNLIRT